MGYEKGNLEKDTGGNIIFKPDPNGKWVLFDIPGFDFTKTDNNGNYIIGTDPFPKPETDQP